ncbi:MAG TPA: hypothetical protein VGK58_15385 [Lacipirellulaceae bacterium]
MPRDEDNDLYDEEFDFVDDDEDADADSDIEAEADIEQEVPVEKPRRSERRRREEPPSDEFGRDEGEAAESEEPVDEYGRTAPAANYVVHIYENKKFKRTIERPFTPEEAEAFATEYNRTAKSYGRIATAGKNDAQPKKTLE